MKMIAQNQNKIYYFFKKKRAFLQYFVYLSKIAICFLDAFTGGHSTRRRQAAAKACNVLQGTMVQRVENA